MNPGQPSLLKAAVCLLLLAVFDSPRAHAAGEAGPMRAVVEVGLAGVYAFAPSRFSQGQGVLSLGVGILFGFDAPSRAPALASRQFVNHGLGAAILCQ